MFTPEQQQMLRDASALGYLQGCLIGVRYSISDETIVAKIDAALARAEQLQKHGWPSPSIGRLDIRKAEAIRRDNDRTE